MHDFQHQILSFEDFTLDLTRGCLRRGTNEVKLRPKSFEVLKFLIEHATQLVSKEQLIAAVWPDTAVTDDSLVQCLIEIRRVLRDGEQRIIKTVPRRGYIFQSEVIRHESSDRDVRYVENVKPAIAARANDAGTKALASSLTRTPRAAGANRSAWMMTLLLGCAAVALILIGLTVYRYRNAPRVSGKAPIRSIAVLPLRNLSKDPANEYFSDGMTESLISALSRVSDLKVISPASVIRFKDQESDPRTVGKQLGVAAVLEGSVRKSADSVRVAVRLVSTEDGHVLLARDTYERALGDVFLLQDDIARNVVTELRVSLNGEVAQRIARRYTEDIEAYQLYLKGRYFWNKRTEDSLKKSIDYFEAAISKDPRFALAHAGIADSYAVFNLYSSAQLPDALPKARDAAQHALTIDDSLAEAHTVLALVKEQYDWDWSAAEAEFKTALALNPNYATAHQYYSEFLAFRGRTEESLEQIKQAHDLDPLSLIINTTLGYPYLCARQCGPAILAFEKALEMDPNFFLAIFYRARCYELDSMYDRAIGEYQKAVSVSHRSSLSLAGLGHAYGAAGKKDLAREVLRELTALTRQRYVSPYLIGTVYAGLGENDEALKWLEKAHREHDYSLVLLRVDARLDGLRRDLRFAALQERIDLAR